RRLLRHVRAALRRRELRPHARGLLPVAGRLDGRRQDVRRGETQLFRRRRPPICSNISRYAYRDRTNGPYCLVLGRLIQRKGLALAVEATRRAGIKLIVAGQGEAHILKDGVLQVDGMRLNAKHVGFVGYADPKKRADLMGNAQSFICPTQYLEPFGGVGVEAQLCGTPVISTDWGAFTETVEHGVSGYRCRTMEQFVWALKNADRLDRMIINTRARRLYSLERVGAMYEEYFDMLSTLWGDGFNADRPREQLDWLTDPFVEGSLWPSR